MKKIAVIGCTGSIGVQTLNVIRRFPKDFKVVSLSGGYNAGLFLRQIEEFKPSIATLASEVNSDYTPPKGTDLFIGENAFLNAITKDTDIVVIALVGFQGLIALLKAIELGKNVALANKESLVVGGELAMNKAKEKGITILPIDSEHSAIWQALNFDFNKEFHKIILTASGGAFRDLTEEQLKKVKSSDALKHPNWKMGNKITIDCATLINKAFETAEAKWLYNTDYNKIEVVIHRESIIHSMVEHVDGSVIAQMSNPDMELPIQLALTYPKRFDSGLKRLNLADIGTLSFDKIDNKRFPCYNLALDALKRGGCYPAVLNGANEAAVKLFLGDKIKFSDFYKCIDSALQAFNGEYFLNIDNLKEANDFGLNYVKSKYGE